MNNTQTLPSLIFFGTPEFARYCLATIFEAGFTIKAVVTAPDRKAGRGKKINSSVVKQYALKKELTVLQPVSLKDPDFVLQLKELQADIQVVVAFRMLPKVVWELPRLGTLNLHASLLPNYRGAAPINWVLINGETKTGVTTFLINEQIDTGAVLLQKETDINPEDNFQTLHDRLLAIGAPLIIQTLEGLNQGSLKPNPQIETGKEAQAPKLVPDNTKINWVDSLDAIQNKIKGLDPYPGAWSFFVNQGNEERFKIFKAHKREENHSEPLKKIIIEGNSLLIATSNGFLICTEIQLPNKKRMSTKALLNGYRFDENAFVL
jgi:methionyl-tRNA formyltransferase